MRTLIAHRVPRLKSAAQHWYTGVLAAIIDALLPDYPHLDPATYTAVQRDVTRYVASQITTMPTFLRQPYLAAIIAFNWLPLFMHLRSFSALARSQQLRWLALWSDSPIGPMRDFVKLIRSCTLLAYFDHPSVLSCLLAERPPAQVLARVAAG